MRLVSYFCILVCLTGVVRAQEQDQKLLDRLLKPNTGLQNDAQNKKFEAGGQTTTRQFLTKSFFFWKRKPEKAFWNTKQLSTKDFATENSRFARKTAILSTRSQLTKIDRPYATNSYGDIRTARDAKKSVAVSNYPNTQPFLIQGKSQKALSAQNQPMSIDEVRELLNKNK